MFRTFVCRSLCIVLTFESVSSLDASEVTSSDGRIEVQLTGKQYALEASVRVSYRINNTTGKTDSSPRLFPIATSKRMGRRSCRVTVDGKQVEFKEVPLVKETGAFGQERSERVNKWHERIEHWIQQDEKLLAMVARSRRLIDHQDEVRGAVDEFEELIKAQLIDKRKVHDAQNVANGHPNLSYLVRLMPEVDVRLRVDQPHQGRPYISLIDEYSAQSFQPYEDDWRRKVDAWLMSTPRLKQLVPKLRTLWTELREGHALLDGPIVKHLHDVNGLDLPVTLQFKRYLQQVNNAYAAKALAPLLFSDVRKLVDAEEANQIRRLRAWGFDQSTVSLFTGHLLDADEGGLLSMRDAWRDASVLKLVGRPTSPGFSNRHRRSERSPALLQFDKPLSAGESADVNVEFRTPLQPRNSFGSSGFSLSRAELVVVLPGDAEVFVTTKPGLHCVVSPAPKNVEVLEDKNRQFTGVLKQGQALHVAPTIPGIPGVNDSGNLKLAESDLLEIIARTTNLTVKPLQEIALYEVLLHQREHWRAHQLAQQIKREHSGFADYFEESRKSNHLANEAGKRIDWIRNKSQSPEFKSDADFRPFARYPQEQLSSSGLAALADQVGDLDVSKLTVQERLGRLFLLWQAHSKSTDLETLLEIAQQNPDSIPDALKLIEHLKGDKSAALEFVIAQIDPKFREREKRTNEMTWRQNAAYSALRSFRTKKTAPRIITFMNTTTDSLLIQGAVDALSETTLPEYFDQLAALADRVARSSESAYIQYLNLLLRSDRSKAVPLLVEFEQRHPRIQHRIMRALGRVKYQPAIKKAMKAYQESNDIRGEVQAAISVLTDLADPDIVAALTYRKGLKPWMNESLVSVIRMKSGDRSHFAFVESFYKEFVRGQKKHNHVTCVAAFEQIGDERAVPYLKEILKSTERKQDAANALGQFLFPGKTLKRKAPHPLDNELRLVAQSSVSPANNAEIELAFTAILQNPDESFHELINRSPLRDAIEDARYGTFDTYINRVRFVSRFGQSAARELLAASEDCSLEKRYMIARLLQLVLPESRSLVQEAAGDVGSNLDRRLTAQLALAIADEKH